jgi:hypothetical protein
MKNPWNLPLLVVSKKFGRVVDPNNIQLCVNFRVVNKKMKVLVYQIPTIVEMLEKMRGIEEFTELDLSAAYHQVEIDKELKLIISLYILMDVR